MFCKICRKNVVTRDFGYCYKCKRNAARQIAIDFEQLEKLKELNEQDISAEQESRNLEQVISICRDLRLYRDTPAYKSNFQEDVREYLYLFGGTESDYRKLVGHRETIFTAICFFVVILIGCAAVAFVKTRF